MTRRRSRGLNPEEAALWHRVAQTVRPLRPGRTAEPPPPHPPDTGGEPPAPPATPPASPAAASAAPPPPAAPIPPFRIGERAGESAPSPGHGLVPAYGASLPSGPLRMDARAFAKLGRGKLHPEARIDLHGLTLAEAEPALARFVLSSQAAGRRLVLVITGKGRTGAEIGPIPARQGLLRAQVPIWLGRPPLSAAVVQAVPAHRRHGGEGAFYVWLRRHPGGRRGAG